MSLSNVSEWVGMTGVIIVEPGIIAARAVTGSNVLHRLTLSSEGYA